MALNLVWHLGKKLAPQNLILVFKKKIKDKIVGNGYIFLDIWYAEFQQPFDVSKPFC